MQEVQWSLWCYSKLSPRVIQPSFDAQSQKIYICRQVEFGWQLDWSMLHVNCRNLTEFFLQCLPLTCYSPLGSSQCQILAPPTQHWQYFFIPQIQNPLLEACKYSFHLGNWLATDKKWQRGSLPSKLGQECCPRVEYSNFSADKPS